MKPPIINTTENIKLASEKDKSKVVAVPNIKQQSNAIYHLWDQNQTLQSHFLYSHLYRNAFAFRHCWQYSRYYFDVSNFDYSNFTSRWDFTDLKSEYDYSQYSKNKGMLVRVVNPKFWEASTKALKMLKKYKSSIIIQPGTLYLTYREFVKLPNYQQIASVAYHTYPLDVIKNCDNIWHQFNSHLTDDQHRLIKCPLFLSSSPNRSQHLYDMEWRHTTENAESLIHQLIAQKSVPNISYHYHYFTSDDWSQSITSPEEMNFYLQMEYFKMSDEKWEQVTAETRSEDSIKLYRVNINRISLETLSNILRTPGRIERIDSAEQILFGNSSSGSENNEDYDSNTEQDSSDEFTNVQPDPEPIQYNATQSAKDLISQNDLSNDILDSEYYYLTGEDDLHQYSRLEILTWNKKWQTIKPVEHYDQTTLFRTTITHSDDVPRPVDAVANMEIE